MAPERVTVTIQSRAGRDAPLTVHDAMHQILDFFDLLSSAGGNESGLVSWRLVDVSMKSPLSATAEAFSEVAGVFAEPIARREKAALASSIVDLSIKGTLPQWMDSQTLHKAREFFKRNMNGIGLTEIFFDENVPPLSIGDKIAFVALRAIERSEQALADKEIDLSRVEFGSIEGCVTAATTYYRRPAINIIERLSGVPVQCVLSDELAEQVGHQHDWSEVWEGRRVITSGEIFYKKDGTISRMHAISIRIIDPISIQYHGIADPNFTGGPSPAEYLEKLWEGDIG